MTEQEKEAKEEIRKLKKKLRKQERKNSEIKDHMAIQRTIFANERTLMAYLRTAIALIGGGFAAVKLSDHTYIELMGLILMPAGLLLAVYSFLRYLRKQKVIKSEMQKYMPTSRHREELRNKKVSDYGGID